MPQTNLGRWTGLLSLVLAALFVWLIVGINSGGILRGSPLAKTLGLSWSAAAVVTFVLALVSRFKLKDRAAVVVVAMVLGGICTILAAFELVEIALSILR